LGDEKPDIWDKKQRNDKASKANLQGRTPTRDAGVGTGVEAQPHPKSGTSRQLEQVECAEAFFSKKGAFIWAKVAWGPEKDLLVRKHARHPAEPGERQSKEGVFPNWDLGEGVRINSQRFSKKGTNS